MFLAQIVQMMVTPSPRPDHDGTPAEIVRAQINPLPPLPIYTLLIFFHTYYVLSIYALSKER